MSPLTFFRNLSLAKQITFILVIGTTVSLLAYIIIWGIRPEFRPLYTNLSAEDAGVILNRLKEEGIAYEVSGTGTIMVPGEKVFETRMSLASQGLPQGSGVGFEIFDTAKFGVTRFEQNVNYQRALQGELSRSINSLTEVSASRVHVVMASESVFTEKEKPATASVVIKLHPGRQLENAQINGVIHLVSSAVDGLRPENVTVVDNEGKLLSGASKGTSFMRTGSDQLDYQQRVERYLQNRVKSMLDEVLGPNQTIVRLSCDIDFERHERTEEMYQPDNKVTRSEQISNTTSRGDNNEGGGVPGVLSNMTDMNASGAGNSAGDSTFSKKEQTANYEIGKVVRHIVEPFGVIKRLSVAVVVDGTYTPVEAVKGGRTVKTGETEYTPRTPEEMAKIKRIVQRAVNYDEERGDWVEVENIQFERTPEKEVLIEEDWNRGVHTGNFIKYGFIIIILFLFYVFLFRPILKWITTISARDSEILRQLPMTVGEAEREYGGGKAESYLEQARVKIRNEPDSSIRTLRDWMKEKR